jgi:2-iminobutanoate/2-iminopropanoate deaminase
VRPIRSDAAPAPVEGAPYSHAIAAEPGEIVWVSGQVPVDPATGQIVDGDVGLQTALALRHVAAILAAAGGGLEHVAKTTVFLVDLGDFAAMNEVYAHAFGAAAPARATVEVAGLPLGARVEIEAVAVLPRGAETTPTA